MTYHERPPDWMVEDHVSSLRAMAAVLPVTSAAHITWVIEELERLRKIEKAFDDMCEANCTEGAVG